MAPRDPFEQQTPSRALAHPKRADRFFFASPYGQGDVMAAGIFPFLEHDGSVHALFGEEDMSARDFQSGPGSQWQPALAILGGKVDRDDTHWLRTVARELGEEVGGLLSASALEDVATFDASRGDPWKNAHISGAPMATYVPGSKYMAVFCAYRGLNPRKPPTRRA